MQSTKHKYKRLLSALLSICMVSGLFAALPITASAAVFPPPTSVNVNGERLYYAYPYLLKNGECSVTGSLGPAGNAMAHFNYTTGVLTLYDYNGGGITSYGADNRDYMIKLIGSNTITVSGPGQSWGIRGTNGSNFTITADAAATLNINVSSTDATVAGIVTSISSGYATGNITIAGKANVLINAAMTAPQPNTLQAFGIFSNEDCYVLDEASLTITCSATTSNTILGAIGIYTEQKAIINTTGNVSIDTTNHTGDTIGNYAIRSSKGITLIKVNLMTLKWAQGGGPHAGGNGHVTYNASNFSVWENNTTRIKTFRYGAPLIFTNSAAYNIPAGTVGTSIANVNTMPSVSGGFGAYTFSKIGTWPAWLVLNASTGVITGTPSGGSAATTVTVRVTDTDGAAAEITINVGAVTGANPVATAVDIINADNDICTLNAATPYLVSGAPAANGTLNGTTCTAHFNAATGTLHLWNFNGGAIANANIYTVSDLKISLQGVNTLTRNISGQTQGIGNGSGGDIVITALSAATLNMNLTSSGGGVFAIQSFNANSIRGNIILDGSASVNITASSGGGDIFGIYTSRELRILGNASLNIQASGAGNVWPVYSVSINEYSKINTTGNVTLEITACGSGSSNFAWFGPLVLDKVGLLTLKWASNANGPHSNGSSYLPIYDENNFIVKTDTVNRIKTFKPGAALYFTKDIYLFIPAGYVGTSQNDLFLEYAAGGGTRPYTFSKVGGPDWLDVNPSEGYIYSVNGRPASAQAATTMTVRVTDADGNYKEITIDVGEVKWNPITVTTSPAFDVPAGVVGSSLQYALVYFSAGVSGGSGNYCVSIEEGPAWLSFGSGTGVPNVYVGTRPSTPQAATDALIKVWCFDDVSNAAWFRVNVGAVVEALSIGNVGSYDVPAGAWSTAMTEIDLNPLISGGMGTYTFTNQWGTPHEWVSLSADGKLTGTRPGSYRNQSTVGVRVEDAIGNIETFSINVGAVYEPLSFTNSTAYNIPATIVGTAITPIYTWGDVQGGYGSYTFSATGLPAGITIESATGIISGSPTSATSAGTATITVTDEMGTSRSITISYGAMTALTSVTFTAVQTGGTSGTADSTGIVLTFSTSVTGLTANDITITNSTGAVTKGTLSGSGTSWTIGLASVTTQGNVTVSVANFGTYIVVTGPQTVAVYKNTTVIPKPGDINRDGVVDSLDLGILIANYGKSGAGITNPNADLNGDGVVDSLDLGLLIANYGK